MLTSSNELKSENIFTVHRSNKGRIIITVSKRLLFIHSRKTKKKRFVYFPPLPPNNLRSFNFVILDERKRFPL